MNRILREALVSTKLKKLVICHVMLAMDIDQSLFDQTGDIVGLSNWEDTDDFRFEMIVTREELDGGDGNEYYDHNNGNDDDSDYGGHSDDDDDDGDNASNNDYSSDGEEETDNHDNSGDGEGNDEKPSQPIYQGCQNGEAKNKCGAGADSESSGDHGVRGGKKRGFQAAGTLSSYGDHSGGESHQATKKRKVNSQNVEGTCLRCDLCNVTSNSKVQHEQHMNGKRHRQQKNTEEKQELMKEWLF